MLIKRDCMHAVILGTNVLFHSDVTDHKPHDLSTLKTVFQESTDTFGMSTLHLSNASIRLDIDKFT